MAEAIGEHWRDLSALDLADRAEYGGKAAHLGHAAALGCPVLRGVALSTWFYQRIVEQGGLLGEIASILNTMQPRTMPQFEAAAWAIRSAFGVRRVPEEVRHELLAAWRAVEAPSVGLRSSSTIEDSATRSFVGQHISTLNITDEAGLLAAALESWASLFSAKALSYAHRFGVDLLAAQMGLLIQPMVTSEARGALFTADPVTGDSDRFILEIHQGAERGVFDLDPYSRKPGELSYWSQLRYYGLLLDEHDLAYQAIEWVIDQDHLTFIRVRPATAVPAFVPTRSIPAVTAPVALLAPAAVPERALCPYTPYDLSRRFGRQRAAAAFDRSEAPSEIEVSGYVYRSTLTPETRTPLEASSLGLLAEVLRASAAAARIAQEAASVLATHSEWIASLTCDQLASMPGPDLARLLEGLRTAGDALVIECSTIDAALDNLLAALTRIEVEWGGLDQVLPQSAAHRRTAVPCADSWWLAELVPPPDEILTGTKDAGSPTDGMALIKVDPTVMPRLNRLRRFIYAQLLDRGRQLQTELAAVSEAAASCRACERAAVYDAGRRLHAVGLASEVHDAALLEARELDRWLHGELRDEMIVRAVMRRREERRRAWRYAPPRRLGEEPEGAPLDMGSCDLVLRGLGVSAGAVQGRARVVRSMAEAPTVLPGEVLICQQATYELSPLFSAVAAIVTAQGALLDHGGVLVREYGLPAVFAVPDVVERLKTGDELLVDATRSLVGRVAIRRMGVRRALDEL